MNELRDRFADIYRKLGTVADFAASHRFTALFIVMGLAVSFALLRSSTYLDIDRNEIRYSDEAVKINYKSIDEDILDEFSQASKDQTIQIDPQFDPNRDNPFSDQTEQ